FYTRTAAFMTARTFFQNGVTVQTRTLNGNTAEASLIPAYPNTLCGPPDASGAPPSCPAPAAGAGNPILVFFSPNYTQPYTQQGSFGLEMELGKDLAVSASYLLVRGTHLQRTRDINLAIPTTPATIAIASTTAILTYQKFTLPRPIAGFDRIWLFE